MLFYFTATGNSLYVAKRLDANPISIPQVLREENLCFKAETIGIVCPINAGNLPGIVVDFLRKASFETDYFYMVMTYGNDHTDAAECAERTGKELGVRIDYIHTVGMVDNYLPVFDMNEQIAVDKKSDEQIQTIIDEITLRTHKIPAATEQERELHASVAKLFSDNPHFNNGESIIVKEKCNGCGICTQVCPIGNVAVEDGKAKRHNSACNLFCLACVHHCPQKAMGLVMDKNADARYRNEHVSLQEIINANNQH